MVARPDVVAHADWSTRARGRWVARARLSAAGRFVAFAPEPVGDASTLLARLRSDVVRDAAVVVGFDFPIGVPRRYAQRVGLTSFRDALVELGSGSWSAFYDVAERAEDVSLARPFYPRRPGGTAHSQLLGGLGFDRMDELLRRCERAHPERRAASPLFWTLGGAQVGKAAITGWRDVLAPALRDRDEIAVWPFDGPLPELVRPRRTVVVETYPAEFYGQLGFTLRKKSDRSEQARVGGTLVRAAAAIGVELGRDARDEVERGFASDDAFDAFVGLLGMLNVLSGRRPAGEPRDDHAVVQVEGWMLGLHSRDGAAVTDERR